MKLLCKLTMLFMFAAVVGCGNDVSTANKNLKDVDPNAPRPKISVEGGKGGAGADKPAPVK